MRYERSLIDRCTTNLEI